MTVEEQAVEMEVVDVVRDAQIRELASGYGKEGEIEFDEGALISEGDDNGAYVQAWVWVSFAGTDLDKSDDDEDEDDEAES